MEWQSGTNYYTAAAAAETATATATASRIVGKKVRNYPQASHAVNFVKGNLEALACEGFTYHFRLGRMLDKAKINSNIGNLQTVHSGRMQFVQGATVDGTK